MQGNLSQIQLPEVLQFISMGKNSGRLAIKDPGGNVTTLVIYRGKIVNSSALERQRRLGELLIHRGHLKRSSLTQLLAIQRTADSNKRLGEILIERDLIQESTLAEVLRLQLEEEIWNLFGLESGDFNFEQDDHLVVKDKMVEIDIEPLLLEGTRRQDEWRKILKILPSDNLVIRVNDPRPFMGNEKIKLSPHQWKILSQINGKTSVRGIINRSGLGRFECYRVLNQFIQQGLLFIEGEEDRISSDKQKKSKEVSPVTGNQVQSSGKNKGGLFSMLTGGGKKDDAQLSQEFVSPVGCLANLINRLLSEVSGMKEFQSVTSNSQTIKSLWDDVLVVFTKADLVEVHGIRVDVQKVETFFDLFEMGEATQDCYEDTLEALMQFLDQLVSMLAKLPGGDRQVIRLVKDLADQIKKQGKLKYQKQFDLADRVGLLLRLSNSKTTTRKL